MHINWLIQTQNILKKYKARHEREENDVVLKKEAKRLQESQTDGGDFAISSHEPSKGMADNKKKEERQSRRISPRGRASQVKQENNGFENGNKYVDTVNRFNVMFSKVDTLTFEINARALS